MGDSKKCIKCKLDINENRSGFQCYGCNRFLHTQSANITATGVKCLQLQTRKLFFCEDCEQIPVLRKIIDLLQLEVENLKNRRTGSVFENELIINELFECQKRSTNLILYNLPEPIQSETTRRIEHDKEEAHAILRKISQSPLRIKNSIRLGKEDDEVKQVKVILEDAEEVLAILKNKRNPKISPVRISNDQTPQQQEYYRNLKTQLEERKARGEEDISIRYFRGSQK
ncbi:hypothetical protein JTB14_014978 [Gonioctena quinquepunctata]|nr:hypothetical protein JTB14_014978 [Gonioctena quinquepunctata]